ncbi:galactose oxidase [Spirosoma sp. HMF3257]|uniref:Galactose oxidase n=1 Tax=Spirosoma telluris TaxID=2183553 RepID=A0A327NS96_9BACT|nr:galactose oxidase [Spirosoma telluris]RAI76816.1 galactose oxidase [Spirosoma telluris]
MTSLYSTFGLSQTRLHYNRLPDLPAQNGQPNPGVAGAFAGVSHNALIVAGGANFPNGYPWQGGTKVWHSDVYVLTREGDNYRWQITQSMDRARAYGASVVWREQLICMGGNDAQHRFADVFSLSWNPATASLDQQPLPSMPMPLANLAATISGHTLYVFGGESDQGTEKSLFALDLNATATGWQKLSDLPGPARAYTTLVAQLNGSSQSLYVVGGRQTTDGLTNVYADAYEYQIGQQKWVRLPDLPQTLAAHQAIASGSTDIVVIGGDDGKRLQQIEALNNRLKVQSEGTERDRLTEKRNQLQISHPGFVKTIWQFQPQSKTWSVLDTLPFPVPVTTSAVMWGASVILPSGEVTPGIRTPAIWKVDLDPAK